MKSLFTILVLLAGPGITAQERDPVNWSATYKASGKDMEGEVLITGTIQKGWHTYSLRPTDAGPVPTSFSFAPSPFYILKGRPEEKGAREEFVPAFEAKIFVFHDKAEFTQKIRLAKAGPFMIPVAVEYMSCNDVMCLPPKTVTLQVKIQ